MQIFLGFFLAIIIAYLAYRARSLDRSGALAALVVGTVIFGLGGLSWAILLLTFFITSSGLSRMFKSRKREANEKYAKGGQRDAGQVFGNGGIATLFAALHFFFPGAAWPWLGFAASLAAVNADTWATELGVLNPTAPRLITDLRKVVEKGTSGGVSWGGTLASFAGAGLIGLEAALLNPSGTNWLFFVLVTVCWFAGRAVRLAVGGNCAGHLLLSILPERDREASPHIAAAHETTQIRGWTWLDNDWVNFACGAFGVGISLAYLILI